MTKPNPKYVKYEAYMNGWNAFCYDKRNPIEETIIKKRNPYNHEYQKLSYDLWYQGYFDSTGDYQVWDHFIGEV